MAREGWQVAVEIQSLLVSFVGDSLTLEVDFEIQERNRISNNGIPVNTRGVVTSDHNVSSERSSSAVPDTEDVVDVSFVEDDAWVGFEW